MRSDRGASKTIETAFALGFSLPDAIQRALERPLTEFGLERGFRKSEVSMCLNGYHQRVYPEIRDALCDELSIDREFLDAKIDEQAARAAATAESA